MYINHLTWDISKLGGGTGQAYELELSGIHDVMMAYNGIPEQLPRPHHEGCPRCIEIVLSPFSSHCGLLSTSTTTESNHTCISILSYDIIYAYAW